MNGLCSRERLQRALTGSLDVDDESALHLHLEECPLCSEEMVRLSGGEQASDEIASLFSPDELSELLPLRWECSTADFVVDHLEPSDDPAALGRLGGYDVLDVIGRGGMGVVLKGFDPALKRFVAIKALAPHLSHSALARKRFAREAQAAAAVVNPHVIAIHHVQPNGPLPFLVMPLLTGDSLAQRLAAQGTLELKEILRIGMQAAEGLAAAHGQGLIHRDVKPANILLEKGVERAVLTDFGLARAADDVSMTRRGIIAGTPEYMSPEQARGEALDGRSDLFSLGCVLYEMATGVSPFRADSTIATLRRIVDEKSASMASLVSELPPWFNHIVERLLAKDPADRFASASELSQLLEQCLSHLQQPTTVELPSSLSPPKAVRVAKRHRTYLEVLAVLATLAVGLAALFASQGEQSPIAADDSRAKGAATRNAKEPLWRDYGVTSNPVSDSTAKVLEWIGLHLRPISRGEFREKDVFAKYEGGLDITFSRTHGPAEKAGIHGTEIVVGLQEQPVLTLADLDAAMQKAVAQIRQEGKGSLQFDVLRNGETVRIEISLPPSALDLTDAGTEDSRAKGAATTNPKKPLWRAYGVTSSPVSDSTAKVLEWIGLHLRPISRDEFREKDVFAKYEGGLDITFSRTHGPAEKAGIHGTEIVVGLQEQPVLTLADLDAAMQKAVAQIKQEGKGSLQFDVLRNGETVRIEISLPPSALDLSDAATEDSRAKGAATRNAKRPLWRAYGVTSSPVSDSTAKVLEWIGLHLRPISRDEFREKDVFAKYEGGLDITFSRTHGPAEKAGIHGTEIVVGLQEQPVLTLADLEAAMQKAVAQIKQEGKGSLQFDVLRNGETVRIEISLPPSARID